MELEPLVLNPANISASGIVVDELNNKIRAVKKRGSI
jgi:hypothetical protein